MNEADCIAKASRCQNQKARDDRANPGECKNRRMNRSRRGNEAEVFFALVWCLPPASAAHIERTALRQPCPEAPGSARLSEPTLLSAAKTGISNRMTIQG